MIRRLTILALLLASPAAWAQLVLSDFAVPDGERTVVAALFEAGGNDEWYRVSPASGTLIDGELELDTFGTINRIRGLARGLVINKNGSPGWSTILAEGGALRDVTFWLQTATETASVSAVDRVGSVGGGFVDITMGPVMALSATIGTGDRFIFAITQPAAADNCGLYLGGTDLTAPGDLRLGAVTPIRFYLGAALVCGASP